MYNGYGYPPPHQAQQPSWQAQTPQQQYGYNNVGATHQAPPYGGPGGYIQPMQQHIPNPAYTAPAPAPVPPQYGLSQQAGHNSYYAGAPPVSHSAYPAPPLHAPQPTIPPFYLGAKLAADPYAPTATVPASLPGYDPSSDVDVIRKATKGFGTDENALNRVLCLRSAEEIQVLLQAYRSRHGKDLIDLLKKETSGYYERTLVALATGPLVGDVELLHDAIAGAGTKESIVTEILVGRHPNEMLLLRHAYERRYHKSMDKEILDDLSFKTKDAFSIVLQGRWQDNGCVQHDLIERDLHDLLPAFRFGFTNEMLICSIIFARSPVYLQALVPAFKQRHGKSLTNQIKQHFSGHLQDALLFAVEGGKRDGMGIWRDAKRLEAAMKGAGTRDILLIARIVRGHWDRNRFEQIKLAYQQKYKKALLTRVQGETSGHYRDCLLTIVKGH